MDVWTVWIVLIVETIAAGGFVLLIPSIIAVFFIIIIGILAISLSMPQSHAPIR